MAADRDLEGVWLRLVGGVEGIGFGLGSLSGVVGWTGCGGFEGRGLGRREGKRTDETVSPMKTSLLMRC